MLGNINIKETSMKRLIMDLDDTICATPNGDYSNAMPRMDIVEKIREYRNQGFEIIINTSRNVRTYNGNVGKINANTLPLIINWLKEHNVPFDEIYIGKPWCGHEGFYVDDKAIRPNEFLSMTYNEIKELTGIY
jgi:capsule biosynthesis phosphatase